MTTREGLLNRVPLEEKTRVSEAINNGYFIVLHLAPDRTVEKVLIGKDLAEVRAQATGKRTFENTRIINELM